MHYCDLITASGGYLAYCFTVQDLIVNVVKTNYRAKFFI